jgi:prolyl 4-hydroxylase
MTQNEHDSIKQPRANGIAAKFFNMGPENLRLYWNDGRTSTHLMNCKAFHSVGTASFPGHKFFFATNDFVPGDKKHIRKHFNVVSDTNNYYYDPVEVVNDEELTNRNLGKLSLSELSLYNKMKRNRLFAKEYRNATGRDYLSMYPRSQPMHYMWRADYFGQKHWVTSLETHFAQIPPESKMKKISHSTNRKLKDDEPRLLAEYRTDSPYLNMTLEVLSCRPRAFEIQNFLSEAEIQHILHLANVFDLRLSTTAGSSDYNEPQDNRKTRTSYNTWVDRGNDPIIDAIYRRAADLMRIDEALLRHRDDKYDDISGTHSAGTLAEALQLVHYDVGQEYTAHHDFGYPDVKGDVQPHRFATLLLYLNEGMEGGETEFPRWVNPHTSDGLKAVPKVGKAVLFYSQLPDGNMDDLSQHSANPVRKGEKFLINLWVWDPKYDR